MPTLKKHTVPAVLPMLVLLAMAQNAFAAYQVQVPLGSNASAAAPLPLSAALSAYANNPIPATVVGHASGPIAAVEFDNNTTAPVPISAATVTGAGLSLVQNSGDPVDCATIGAVPVNGWCFGYVQFSPTSAGQVSGQYSVNVSGADAGTVPFALSPTGYASTSACKATGGAAVTADGITVSPGSLTFDVDASCGPVSATLTFTNNSTSTREVDHWTSSPSSNPSAPSTACAGLAPGASCTTSVTIDPTVPFDVSSAVTVATDATGQPTHTLMVPVSVTAPKQALAVDPITATLTIPGMTDWSSGGSCPTPWYYPNAGTGNGNGLNCNPYVSLPAGGSAPITVTAKSASGKPGWIEITEWNSATLHMDVVASGFGSVTYAANPDSDPRASCNIGSQPPGTAKCQVNLYVQAFTYGPSESPTYNTQNPGVESYAILNLGYGIVTHY